jgi:hypothetical protein
VEEFGDELRSGHSRRCLAYNGMRVFGGKLNHKATKGCGINGLGVGEGCYMYLRARAKCNLGTAQESGPRLCTESV